MYKSNRGMALVVTMVILAVTLMLGMSAFGSALLSERMAGNYRASMQAYSEAETGIANASNALRNPEEENFTYDKATGVAALNAFLSDVENDENLKNLKSLKGNLADLGGYKLDAERVDPASNEVAFLLISKGSYGAAENQAHRRVAGLFSSTRGGEVPGGVTSCEGISLSGMIDSYDSRNGPYGYLGNARRSNAVITTRLDGAPITMDSAPIYGKVNATGDLTMLGSGAAVIGGITANGNVTVEGKDWWNEETGQYGNIFGNADVVGSISIKGTIQGNVRANQAIDFAMKSSKINGDATAPVMNHEGNAPLDDHVSGTISQVDPGIRGVASVASPEECSDFAVPEYWDKLAGVGSSCSDGHDCSLRLEGQSAGDVVFSKKGITNPKDGSVYKAHSFSINGRDLSVVRLDSFTQKSHRFIIGEPDKPIDAVMIIAGDTLIEGTNTTFKISEGSTLQIVTNGKFKSSSGILVGDNKPSKVVDGTVVPVMSLLSIYQDQGQEVNGVQLKSSSAIHGLIAAPFSYVEISGGDAGAYGAIHGRKVAISGSGSGFHYDESLSEMQPLDGGGGWSSPSLIEMFEVL